jgi:hypothetical protein
MSRTFLQLCQDVVSDLGIAGGTLGSTIGSLNQEQVRICNWVARADLYIQNLWADWQFLWYQDNAVTCAAGSNQLITVPPTWSANIQNYDNTSLWINPGLANAQRIRWMPWDKFRAAYKMLPPQSAGLVPVAWSYDPDGNLWLSQNMSQLSSFSLEYWVVGQRMTNDQSVSPIPNNFDSIICERAKIIYAGRENAPEILTSASAEYVDQLDKMQAYCLPNNTAGRTSQNNRTTVPESYVE